MEGIRLLLVDDNAGFLKVAAEFLSQHPELQIVGQTQSGQEAIGLANELCPDLVLMDMSMPGMGGLEATRRIKTVGSAPSVIILTLNEGTEFSSSAYEAGADGFVTKSEFGEALLPEIGRLFPELEMEPANQCA
jgi:DNA-binding NarL/FixJ family response regulator